MRKSSTCFFMAWFAMNDNSEFFFGNLTGTGPNFFYKRTGSVIAFCMDTLRFQKGINFQTRSKRRRYYNIGGLQIVKRDQLFPLRILEKLNPSFFQIIIHLRIMNHFAEKKNGFSRIFFNCSESDVNGIFNTIAKSEMPGQVDMQEPEIKQGRRKIFFHPVFRPPFILDGRDERTAISRWDLKSFHSAAKLMVNP